VDPSFCRQTRIKLGRQQAGASAPLLKSDLGVTGLSSTATPDAVIVGDRNLTLWRAPKLSPKRGKCKRVPDGGAGMRCVTNQSDRLHASDSIDDSGRRRKRFTVSAALQRVRVAATVYKNAAATAVATLDEEELTSLVWELLKPSHDPLIWAPGDDAVVAIGFPAIGRLSEELWLSRMPARDLRILRVIYRIAVQCDDPADVDVIIRELKLAQNTVHGQKIHHLINHVIDRIRHDPRWPTSAGSSVTVDAPGTAGTLPVSVAGWP
jgi:hypothetical protein